MTKHQAVRLSNSMAGLRPVLVKHPGRPKWNSWLVEHSVVYETEKGELIAFRELVG